MCVCVHRVFQLSNDTYLGQLCILVIINSAAINMNVQMSL